MNSQAHVLYPKRAIVSSAVVASQSLTVSTAAVAIGTAFATPGVDMVTFDVQTNDVRVRWDGTSPTGTVGHVLPAGTAYTWDTAQFNAAKFIRVSTASADATIFASAMSA